MTRILPYLLPLTILIIRRHAAAAWLVDTVGHPEHWLVVALATWSLVSVGVVCAVLFIAVLAWDAIASPVARKG